MLGLEKGREKMNINTVNISFKKELLSMIDKVAAEESRSRSELIREAARMYIERRKKWNAIFSYADKKVRQLNLKEKNIESEINQYRVKKKRG